MKAEQSKHNILYSGIILSIMVVLWISLWVSKGSQEISEFYLDKYIWLGALSIFFGVISMIVIWVKESATFHLPAIASSDENRIIPWTWLKYVIMILFAGLMLFSVTTIKSPILPIPHVLEVGYSISPITEMYYSSVIPGFFEDFAFGFLLPYTFFNFIWLLFYLILKIDLRESKLQYFGAMLIAILISSIGFGLLIPGFAVAHKPVYQDNIGAFASAGSFMFMQSTLYVMTGLFFPLAHIVHNALFTLGWETAFSIGGLSTAMIFFIMNKKKRRKLLHE